MNNNAKTYVNYCYGLMGVVVLDNFQSVSYAKILPHNDGKMCKIDEMNNFTSLERNNSDEAFLAIMTFDEILANKKQFTEFSLNENVRRRSSCEKRPMQIAVRKYELPN